ncbi:MAG: PAS domain S-box protein, partial [Proteobacteria bacterium]|nr:PAS domain S-box protein [Pseudomonadota bacterium]
MRALSHFLEDDGFMPHGMCILWRPDLLLLHAISDSLIAAAYYSIPIALIYFVMKRKDVEFRWMFLLFGAFILACGTTHVLAVWTLWHHDYVADGAVKALTAAASLGTAAALWRVMPTALAIPGRQQLETMNRELRTQIHIRREAEASLQDLNAVLERTAQLERANATLKEEIAERGRAERIARENERRFRNLVEGSIQAILVHRNGKPLFVNQAYARLVGCEGPDEILALASIDRFIAPNDLDRVMRSRAALLRNERPSVDYEIRMQRKDGSSFWAYGQTRMVIWNADPAIQV